MLNAYVAEEESEQEEMEKKKGSSSKVIPVIICSTAFEQRMSSCAKCRSSWPTSSFICSDQVHRTHSRSVSGDAHHHYESPGKGMCILARRTALLARRTAFLPGGGMPPPGPVGLSFASF